MAGERTLPGLGLKGYWTLSSNGWKPDMDANLRLLSALVQPVVKSRTTTLPTGSDGDMYLVKVGDANADKIAIKDLGSWVYITARKGTRIYVEDVPGFWFWDGTAWIAEASGGGGSSTLADLTDVDLAGLADGYLLFWDEADGKWLVLDPDLLKSDLADLPDVDLTDLADGFLLSWDETAAKWVPVAPASAGSTTLAGLSDVDLTGLATGDLLKWNGTDWVRYQETDVVGMSIISKPTASEKLLLYAFATAVSWPTNLSGSVAKAGIAATASTTFTLKKNGSSIGTCVFSAAGTTGAFTVTATTWASGDILSVEAPGTADATLAEISFSFRGVR